MIKYLLLLVYFGWLLWLQPNFVEGNTVSIKLFPTLKPALMELDAALFLAALSGLVVACVIALIDRFGLTRTNRKLTKEVTALRSEISSLRSIVTTDRDHE